MKIALKAEVVADMIVTEPVTAKLHPYDFEICKRPNLGPSRIWLR